MPALSVVYPWPAQGRAEHPADDDPVADVAIRACRSVAELYREELAPLALSDTVTELRLFHRHDPGLDAVHALVDVDPARSRGFEMAHVHVPTGFADRTPQVRAEVLVEVVHGLLTRLAVARGWDTAALDACRARVLERGPEYRWSSPPKTSPDRRLQAFAEFRLPADGYGRVRLHVVRRDDGTTVATSEEAVAFCTSEGFRRAAASLRWHGSDQVSLVPYDFVPAIRGGRLSLSREGDAWHSEVEDYCGVLAVPPGDPALPALAVRVEGRGNGAPEQPSTVSFVGGGPIERGRVERFHDAFGAEMRRLTSPAGQAWWRDADLRRLVIQICYTGDRPRVRGRRGEQRLAVFVDQPPSSLPEGDPAPRARQVTEEVVALVRRRTGLGPHPEIGS